jgi:hypothetical protein
MKEDIQILHLGIILRNCINLKSLGKLKHVNENLRLDFTSIQSLENLEYVGSNLFLQYTPNLKSFGKLKFVGRNFYLIGSNILNVVSIEDIHKQVEVKGKIYWS